MKYTFTPGQRLSIAGAGDFFRILATTSPVDVEFYYQGREIAERLEVEAGFAESFRTIEFDRVEITSALAQTVQFETARGSEIRYDRGAASVTGTVALDVTTQKALSMPYKSTGSFSSTSALASMTAQTVFTPAANANGVILLNAGFSAIAASVDGACLIAHDSTPSSFTTGEVILGSKRVISGAAQCDIGQIEYPQLIAPGKGLYFLVGGGIAASNANLRYARWKAL